MLALIIITLGLLGALQQPAEAISAVISDISKNQVVAVGEDAEFNCTVENVEGYAVGWTKLTDDSNDGGVVLSIRNTLSLVDRRYSITETKDKNNARYTFKITKVESSDMGTYECQVIVSAADKITKNVRLSVKHPPIISEELTPKLVTVTEGHSLEVSCHANGFPQPTISWKREDNSVMPTGSNTFAGSVFRVKQAHRLDRGGYYCIADNGVGNPNKKIVRIEVEFRPQISIPRPKVAQTPSRPVELECIVQGHPSPAVSWHRNGSQLKSGSTYEIRNMAYAHETTRSVLHILNVEDSDYGDYFCNATNKFGNADARLNLFRSVIPIPLIN